MRELADAVAAKIAGTQVKVNPDALPDKRSYRVDFNLFKQLAPDHQPTHTLNDSIDGLVKGLRGMGFADDNFRQSELIRLRVVEKLRSDGLVDERLALTHQRGV